MDQRIRQTYRRRNEQILDSIRGRLSAMYWEERGNAWSESRITQPRGVLVFRVILYLLRELQLVKLVGTMLLMFDVELIKGPETSEILDSSSYFFARMNEPVKTRLTAR